MLLRGLVVWLDVFERPKPNAFLREVEFKGEGWVRDELHDEADEEGRVATRDGDEVTAVLTVFAGLADPARAGGVPEVAGDDRETLDLVGVEGTVGLGRLTLTANALCGNGLIGLSTLSAGERVVPLPLRGPLCSPSSSSEVLNRLRVPTRTGESGFLVGSIIADLGRYFGRAEEMVEEAVLERSVDRLEGLDWLVSVDLTPCSSEEGPCLRRVDCLRRVTVLYEGLSSAPCRGTGDFVFWETVAWEVVLMRLRRREGSLGFLRASRSRESLLITSTSAFPTEVKLREWRREERVEGLDGRVSLDVASAAMRTSASCTVNVSRYQRASESALHVVTTSSSRSSSWSTFKTEPEWQPCLYLVTT